MIPAHLAELLAHPLALGARGELVVAKTLRRTLLACPAGSPTPPGDGRCICPPAGRGRRGLRWRWPGCAVWLRHLTHAGAERRPPDPFGSA